MDNQFQGKEHAKKGFTLFKKKEAVKEDVVPSIASAVNAIDARVKILEGRYNDLSRRAQFSEKSLLEERSRFLKEIKVVNEEILDLKRRVEDLNSKMEIVISELKNCTRKDEIDTLSKYIDLWEPVNFVTRKEVEQIVKEVLERAK